MHWHTCIHTCPRVISRTHACTQAHTHTYPYIVRPDRRNQLIETVALELRCKPRHIDLNSTNTYTHCQRLGQPGSEGLLLSSRCTLYTHTHSHTPTCTHAHTHTHVVVHTHKRTLPRARAQIRTYARQGSFGCTRIRGGDSYH